MFRKFFKLIIAIVNSLSHFWVLFTVLVNSTDCIFMRLLNVLHFDIKFSSPLNVLCFQTSHSTTDFSLCFSKIVNLLSQFFNLLLSLVYSFLMTHLNFHWEKHSFTHFAYFSSLFSDCLILLDGKGPSLRNTLCAMSYSTKLTSMKITYQYSFCFSFSRPLSHTQHAMFPWTRTKFGSERENILSFLENSKVLLSKSISISLLNMILVEAS